jgi:uncharacterized NAD(P)/FAD-binding protein YdhS
VYCPDQHENRRPVIAVIGGGASGTLAAIHLLRLAAAGRPPVRIALIDAGGRHGLGQAYSTTHPGHLLNAPADTMSAVAGDPGQLLRWAAANRAAHDGFLRRSDYGRYLRETLAEAARRAGPGSTVTPVTAQVVRISDCAPRHPLRLHLAADGHIDADIAVLAVGSPAPTAPCLVPDSPRYIADPWAPGALRRAGDGKPVIVLGTGLTAMDVAIAVTDAHPRTVVHAVSRHALLPRAHRRRAEPGRPTWLPALASPGGPVRLGELMWQVRAAMTDRPEAWEEIMDALRPHVPRLWQRLSVADRRVFLRHVARYWEVHRHRMPPETARRVSALLGTGRLSVHAGQVRAVTAGPGTLRVRIEYPAGAGTRHAGTSTAPGAGTGHVAGTCAEHEAGWLINATGPDGDITRTGDPLLRDLFDRGLARPDPLKLGLDATPSGALLDAAGRPSGTLFTLGPPLRGLWYETTAVPEIRTQAAALALRLTAAAPAPARPGTAA